MSETRTPLGVAVIGHSFMGQAHSQAWRNVNAVFDTPPVEMKVLVGRDAAAVDKAAQRYGWQEASIDWKSVVDREDVDIVDICTPGAVHAEMAEYALARGKHVLVEKPLANSLAQAEAMAQAAERASGVCMVGFNYRRVPALALARQMISDGFLGSLRQVNVRYYQDWLVDDQAPMTWRLRKETAGSGALGDLGSHVVDQLHYLFDTRVSSVSATMRTFTTHRPGPEGSEAVTVDDAVWATLDLANGAVATVETTRMATGRKNALRIEAYGSAGAIAFDLEELNKLQVCDLSAPEGRQGFTSILVTEESHPYLYGWWPPGHILGWAETFTHQARDFLTAIRDGGEASATFAEGLAVQQVLDAIESSAAQDGQRIRL